MNFGYQKFIFTGLFVSVMKINYVDRSNLCFKAIKPNMKFRKLSRLSNIRSSLRGDSFEKRKSNKSSFQNPILTFIRNNESILGVISVIGLGLGVVLSNPLISAGVGILGLVSIYANKLPKEIYRYDETVINPIIDKDLTESQKKCKSIFIENFSDDEAKNIAKKYNELLKIDNKEEFIKSTFEELKKDYNIQKLPIKLETNYKQEKVLGMQGKAAMNFDEASQQFIIKISSRESKKSILKSLTHELHHVKQVVTGYQASESFDERVEIRKKYLRDVLLQKNTKIYDSMISDMAKDRERIMSKVLENSGFNINSLKATSLYDYGLKLLKDSSIYESKTKTSYLSSFREIDAFRSAEMMMKLIKEVNLS